MSLTDIETKHCIINTPKGPADIIEYGGMAVIANYVRMPCESDEYGTERFDPEFDRSIVPVESRADSVAEFLAYVASQ